MNIYLIGQKWLGAEVLALLLERGHTIMGVCAPPADRLWRAAVEANITSTTAMHRLPADTVPSDTDLIVAAHAHVFIGADLRARARLGAIGYHPSLLPRHRGKDAIRWALHMGETITGGTVYWMEDKVDAGPIAAQEWCHIFPDDTPDSLWRRELGPMGVHLLGHAVEEISRGIITRLPQDERLATWEPSFDRAPLAKAT